jgi:hypothetical protein
MAKQHQSFNVGTKADPHLEKIQEFFEMGVQFYEQRGIRVKRMPKLVVRDPLQKHYTIGGEGTVEIQGRDFQAIPVGFFHNDVTGSEVDYCLRDITAVDRRLQELGVSLDDLTVGDVPRNKITVLNPGDPDVQVVRPVEVFMPVGFDMSDYAQFGSASLVSMGLRDSVLTYLSRPGGFHAGREFVPELTTKPGRCDRGMLFQEDSPHAIKHIGGGLHIGMFVSAPSGTQEAKILEDIAEDPLR